MAFLHQPPSSHPPLQYLSLLLLGNQLVDGKNIRMINSGILEEIFGIYSKIQQKKVINWIHKGLNDFDQYVANMKTSI